MNISTVNGRIRSVITISIFALGAFTGLKAQTSGNKDKRPNIVVILADDLGFSDIGCYGGEIKTPNIDYLAANGLRFTQFYNTSRCCPTRASLLTGLYNHQAGIGEMSENRNQPGYQGHITKNAVTLAEVLKDAGYNTAMSGKWHVSNTLAQPTPQKQLNWLNHQESHPLFSPIEQYPTNRGFDRFFGTIWGVVDYFDPFSLVSGTTPIISVPPNYYHSDAINDTASAYIRDLAKQDKPFFLYVAENAPHWPLQALPKDIAKYKDTYKAGWDAIREARYKRLVSLGIINPATAPLSPRWKSELSWKDNPDKEWDAHAMAVHAAMVDHMDQGIGRIIKALKETGQLENTLILFLSDNGASPENAAKYGPGFDRPSQTRNGTPIAYPVDKSVLPGPQTSYTSIGDRWANVSNTPYRYAKEESYEGGVHTPLIAFYPKGITVKKGSLNTGRVGHVMDFMATFIELAKAKYPSAYKGNNITPMQGLSLVPALKGAASKGHQALFNEHFGARYARVDNWKLVSTKADSTWHLYQIQDDQTEVNDLASKYPEKVKELNAKWRNWAVQNNVFPKPVKKAKKAE
ncbi:MAG: arylsulfatase [Sphingobacteriaceae bacterium]|jgi:arylsulfatase|nr:arylsulfatase [Sphingobacteriaceae bacterium]